MIEFNIDLMSNIDLMYDNYKYDKYKTSRVKQKTPLKIKKFKNRKRNKSARKSRAINRRK